MTESTDGAEQCNAIVLNADDPLLSQLRADPRVEFLDAAPAQLKALDSLRPPLDVDVTGEPVRWAYYPWRAKVVSVLGPHGFRRLRLDRNRNLVTAAELDRLSRLRIGVVGLSVGHAIAYTLAAQGFCGELRLSDFDVLELSNLNRVPATVFDLGLNKAVVCARRIAELDPYLRVVVQTDGITTDSVDEFMDNVDIVLEECDSLDAKVLVREAARARKLPVLMATSDRCLLDVERFDSEPTRPTLHGLIGDMEAAQLRDLDAREKVPYSLRLVDATQVSARMAASLIEVGTTLSTWPQIASEVALNTAAVAEAVRRIALGEPLASGRVRVDIAEALDRIEEPLEEPIVQPTDRRADDDTDQPTAAGDAIHAVMAAANRAPSGGNAQPWRIWARGDAVSIALAPEYATTMDVGCRASAVAVGAATFNARVAAAAHAMVAEVSFEPDGERSPLVATLRLSQGDDPTLAALYDAMLQRETNRRQAEPVPISADVVELLAAAARREGARLELLSAPEQLATAARILAAADRIRYLTPRLHAEMFAELRWPGDPSPDTGIDVRTLELPESDLVMLDILRRPEVMAHLAAWGGGAALGDDTYDRVTRAAALGVVSMPGSELVDFARAGSAVEAVWVTAQQQGLGVQPVSPAFLYAVDAQDLQGLSPAFSEELADLQYNFRMLAGTEPAESQALILRFAHAPRPSVQSRRRSIFGPVTED
ncbi:Rv1355c family protein [Mycolicibacterium pulveris]|uniref:Rv1355c family protein n=1 Tax=Mycolicibacterium pulveris TaxID=36813 RepID=UPI003CF0685B